MYRRIQWLFILVAAATLIIFLVNLQNYFAYTDGTGSDYVMSGLYLNSLVALLSAYGAYRMERKKRALNA